MAAHRTKRGADAPGTVAFWVATVFAHQVDSLHIIYSAVLAGFATRGTPAAYMTRGCRDTATHGTKGGGEWAKWG